MRFYTASFIFSFISTCIFLTRPAMGQGEDVVQIDSEMLKVQVSESNKPAFSWEGDTKIGRLLVIDAEREYWGTETEGKNSFQSPILYGKNPPQAFEPEQAWPLTAGKTYTVKLFRWISVDPEKFQLVGIQEFTPNSTAPAEYNPLKEKGYKQFEELDPKDFDNPTEINNVWMPLKPGMKYVYDGFTVEDGETIPHRIVLVVTDLTKIINGVRTRIIFDRDYSDGKLEESELTFFAQDNAGNVWHLGQYYELYEEMEFLGGRAWMIGHLDGAKAGIMMKAKPALNTPSYSQGYAPPPFNWTDRGRTYQMGQETTVAAGKFKDVLVTEEFNEEEPGAFQLKYYAQNVGNVRVGWRGDDQQQETMELIEYRQLDPEEMKAVRAEALELEKRASIYCTTQPAEVGSATSK